MSYPSDCEFCPKQIKIPRFSNPLFYNCVTIQNDNKNVSIKKHRESGDASLYKDAVSQNYSV